MSMKKVLGAASLAATVGFASAHAAVVIPVGLASSADYPGYENVYAIDSTPGTQWAALGTGAATYLNMAFAQVYTFASAQVTDRVGDPTDFTTQYSLQAYSDGSFTTAISAPVIVNRPNPVNVSDPAAYTSNPALTGFVAQFLKYQVLATGGANPGLEDIRFTTVDAPTSEVPEPASMALLGLGLGAAAFVRRRRA